MSDLISRKALKTYINGVSTHWLNDWSTLGVLAAIDKQPTVDVVAHAKWHDVYLLTPWIATGICSRCNLKSYINPDFPFAKHCPMCGAKMDGE